LFLEHSSFKEAKPKFQKTSFEKPITTLEDTVNTCPLWSWVTICVKVSEKEPPCTIDSLTFVTTQVVDNSGLARQLTFYNNLCGKIQIGKCYKISNITVSTYMGKRVLKTSEQSVISALSDAYVYAEPPEASIYTHQGKIVNVDMKSLNATVCCPSCKSDCSWMKISLFVKFVEQSAASDGIFKTNVKFALVNANGNKINLHREHQKMASTISVPIHNKIVFLKQLLSLNVLVKVHTLTGKVTQIEEVHDLQGDNANASPNAADH